MANRGSISFTAKQGSYIVGTLSMIMAMVAILPVNYFKRKTLLFWGQFWMAVSLALTAISYIMEQDILIIVFLCIFITAFQFSQGPLSWMYAGEVACDTGLGLSVLALYVSLLDKAITMQFIVNSRMGPTGMFFLLGGVTFLGAIFIHVYVKETKGLTDKEKKELYTPDELKDSKKEGGDIEMVKSINME